MDCGLASPERIEMKESVEGQGDKEGREGRAEGKAQQAEPEPEPVVQQILAGCRAFATSHP